MQSEQQQRIMGYFIEEAKDHLNTIEQGLLSLQSTMDDTEMMNEIFRAAHSIKGGAAMLGLNSIQKTAHRLEDCFKILMESPVKVDNYLETLFLQVFDILQELVEQLQGPLGLTDESARDIMLDAEPVFEELKTHLRELSKQAEKPSIATAEAPKVVLTKVQLNITEDKKMLPVTFKRTVLVELREMLQLFKQQDSPEHRQALQKHCEHLRQIGEPLDLPGWGELLETARKAIAFPPNSYRQLASLTIKEIKQAQELVVVGRSVEVAPSEKLKSLVPTPSTIESKIPSDIQEQDIILTPDINLTTKTTKSSAAETTQETSSTPLISSKTDWLNSPDSHIQEEVTQKRHEQNFTQDPWGIEELGLDTEQDVSLDSTAAPQFQGDTNDLHVNFTHPVSRPGELSEPEVGIAELNSLADIFEGQTPDLEQTWQEEEIISLDDTPLARKAGSQFNLDDQSDFSDLIDDRDGLEIPTVEQSNSDDLMGWLDDESTEELVRPSQESIDSLFSDFDLETTSSTTDSDDFNFFSGAEQASVLESPPPTSSQTSDFADLLLEADSLVDLPATEATNTDDLNSLLGEGFFEENTAQENTSDLVLDAEIMPELQQQDDELFVLPAMAELNDAEAPDLAQAALSPTNSLSLNLSDRVVVHEDYFNEILTENENESFPFENPFVSELEDMGSNARQPDEVPIVESELDLGDLLELSDSEIVSAASEMSEPSGLESFHSSTPQDNAAFGQDLVIDNQAPDFDFEELVLNDSSADFDFASSEDLAWSESPSDRAAHTLNTFDEEDDLLLNWDEPELAREDMDSSALDAYDIDLDLDATSTNLSNIGEKGSGDIEGLFEDDLFSDTPNIADLSSVPKAPDSRSHSTPPTPSGEELQSISFDSSESFDNLFDSQTTDAQVHSVEEFSLNAFAEPEAFSEFDTINDFFDTHSEATDTSAVAHTLDFEDDLFAGEGLSLAGDLEAHPEPTATEPDTLFDLGLDGETALPVTPPESDLAALLGDETPNEMDALHVSSGELDSLDFEEDLFANEIPSLAGDLETHREPTATEPDTLFDLGLDGEAALSVTPPESDLAALLGDETPNEMDALHVSSGELDSLDFEEDLFANEIPSLAGDLEAHREPTQTEPDTLFDLDWGGEAALLGDETPNEIDPLNVSSGELDSLDFEEDLFTNEIPSLAGDLEAHREPTQTEPDTLFDLDLDGEAALSATPPEFDLAALLGDETPNEIDALNVSFDEPEPLDFAQDLFANEALSLAGDSEAHRELTATEADALFDFDEANADEATDNLDNFVGAQADTVTDDQDWNELLNEPQSSDAPNIDAAAFSEDWNFDMEGDESAAALDLDWETSDGALVSESSPQTSAQEDFSFLTAQEDDQAVATGWDSLDELDDLGTMLTEATTLDMNEVGAKISDRVSKAPPSPQEQSLEALEELVVATPEASQLYDSSPQLPEFDDLEAMLGEEAVSAASFAASDLEAFDDLEALLGEQTPATADQSLALVKRSALEVDIIQDDDFGDLEILLEQTEKTMGGPPTTSADQRQPRPLSRQRPKIFEQTMRVPVKHLDSLSNLVGELVVNRNSLEQDQEQLRQFLDNLSHQVLALSDVGSRMQDLYERSLLESSLLASRYTQRSSLSSSSLSSSFDSDSLEDDDSSEVEYDPLEMDRFTGFHLLSQEMIELIVRVRESASDIELLVDGTDQVARMLRQVTTQLQEGLTRSRMVPFAQTADRLPRAVREISLKLRKKAELHVEGRETLIDKMILEHLYDPLTHLVNNAITHGIESPKVRQAADKSPIGRITLRAFHQGNQTVISISDDGAGIDPEGVKQKAIEKRLITAADAQGLTNLDLYDFLFRPGFTTKDKADDFSGRGIGMDVVRTSLSEIRGVVHIDSTLGKGTTFTLRLPLTLSICKALCCLSDRARIAFPMDGVEDMLDMPSDRIMTNLEGQTCIQWRDMVLPFQSLSELLTYKRQLSRNTVYGGKREDDIISIVVLRSAGNFLAIQVDQVLGEQEIVIKQLEGPPPKPVGIAGATVLGDGRIMPIADVLELIDLAHGRIRKDSVTIWSREEPHEQIPEELPTSKPEPMVLIVDDSITVRELLSMTFTKAGYRVEQARDGQEAWDKLRSGLPCDIVFCDIEMPRMDGLELLSRLQKDKNLSHLPIAMLTSRGADRHRQMASQLGANGYFTKPYLEEVLLDAAQRMIKGEVLFSSSSNA